MIELHDIRLCATATMEQPDYGISLCSVGAIRDDSVPIIDVQLRSATSSNALALDANTAVWVFEAVKKLEKLSHLERNWDSYDGLPLSPESRIITFDVLGWLKNQDLPVPSVVLGSNGTVHLEWRLKGKELELGFDGPRAMQYVKVSAEGNIDEGEENAELREKLCVLTSWLKRI